MTPVASPTHDRYGADVLAGDWRTPPRGRATDHPAELGQVVEEVMTDWCGEVVAIDRDLRTLTLEDRRGARRTFPLGPGFLLEGRPVVLTPPVRAVPPAAPTRTASGSRAVQGRRARVARESRIFVEGRHDAELIEKVWGDDLRLEGVVVEYLGGIDDLAEQLSDFAPGPERRVGVLVDHLVPGSKETRIAQAVTSSYLGAHVRILGHPFIDVWQAVRPERLGLDRWPDVPPGEDWKTGTCRRLGWPHSDQADRARAWKHILSRVELLVRPGAGAARARRGADRLRHRRLTPAGDGAQPRSGRPWASTGSPTSIMMPSMKGHSAPTPQVTSVTTSWITPVRVSPMYIRPIPSGIRICSSAATSLDLSE